MIPRPRIYICTKETRERNEKREGKRTRRVPLFLSFSLDCSRLSPIFAKINWKQENCAYTEITEITLPEKMPIPRE